MDPINRSHLLIHRQGIWTNWWLNKIERNNVYVMLFVVSVFLVVFYFEQEMIIYFYQYTVKWITLQFNIYGLESAAYASMACVIAYNCIW